MLIGYARVSIDDQSPALQLAALKRAMCKTIKQICREPNRKRRQKSLLHHPDANAVLNDRLSHFLQRRRPEANWAIA
jgi:DNA invertase Pin-like site-specific DNA recombinase